MNSAGSFDAAMRILVPGVPEIAHSTSLADATSTSEPITILLLFIMGQSRAPLASGRFDLVKTRPLPASPVYLVQATGNPEVEVSTEQELYRRMTARKARLHAAATAGAGICYEEFMEDCFYLQIEFAVSTNDFA